MTGFMVADCPLKASSGCKWSSDPLPSITVALEARRRHVSGHSHADLVEHVAASSEGKVTEYVRAE